MNRLGAAVLGGVSVLLTACGGAPPSAVSATNERTSLEAGVRGVLDAQAAAWNRNDLRAFMDGYERNEGVIYTSGGEVRRGWQTAFDRYAKAYPDLRKAGVLTFSNLEITPLGPDAAVVLGEWALDGEKDMGGVFTLGLRKGKDGWRIFHDHTSSAKSKPEAEPELPKLMAVDVWGASDPNLIDVQLPVGERIDPASDAFRRAELEEESRLWRTGRYAYVDIAVVTYRRDEGPVAYATVDLLERGARSVAYAPAPTERLDDPGGLLARWEEYERTAFALWDRGELDGAAEAPCPALHCTHGFVHPDLAPFLIDFESGVPAHFDALRRVLAKDRREGERAAAAFLVAHAGAAKGREVVEALVAALRDPSSWVRNNAARVLGDVVRRRPDLDVPIAPFLAMLDSPATTDRNKALSVISALLERDRAKFVPAVAKHRRTLERLAALSQPNQRDFAERILREMGMFPNSNH